MVTAGYGASVTAGRSRHLTVAGSPLGLHLGGGAVAELGVPMLLLGWRCARGERL